VRNARGRHASGCYYDGRKIVAPCCNPFFRVRELNLLFYLREREREGERERDMLNY